MKIDVRQIDGYAYGAIQPSTILSFHHASVNDQSFLKKLETLFECMPRFEDPNRFSFESVSLDQSSIPVIFVSILDALNHVCGDQRFTPIHVFQEDTSLSFAVPTLSNSMTRFNINAMKSLLDVAARDDASAKVQDFLETHKRKTRPFLPSGTNAGNFIAAAAERKIPFKIFSPKYVIFGYGSGSRIFNSSITDEESAIGVGLAKSKVDTNRLLKMSGIPVAEQARVRTLEDALSFADKIGYPVVLKPESEEQGRGVKTFLQNQSEVREVFSFLEKNYKNIIIEKHYFGDGYRVYVLNNEVVRVRKLAAAHIVGNGISSIQNLILEENSSKDRNNNSASMKKIIIDNELIRMLKKQDLELDDIPPINQKVLLAETTNLSRGGTSSDFYDQLHPANKVLCEQATQTLGLYCSGVDLISIDASVPWYENGAIICEINAQPQIGAVGKVPMHDEMIVGAGIKRCSISLKIVSDLGQESVSLFNKTEEKISITISTSSIIKVGCPVQYFDELEISDDVSDEERKKIERMLVSVQPDLGPAIS